MICYSHFRTRTIVHNQKRFILKSKSSATEDKVMGHRELISPPFPIKKIIRVRIMPTTKYTLEELLEQCDSKSPISKDQSEWLDAGEKAELYQFLLLSEDQYIKEISTQCEADMDKALNRFFTLLDDYYDENKEVKG